MEEWNGTYFRGSLNPFKRQKNQNSHAGQNCREPAFNYNLAFLREATPVLLNLFNHGLPAKLSKPSLWFLEHMLRT